MRIGGYNKMSGLTQKQEWFCLAYIETGNASEAYRMAYDAGRMKDATIHKRASELMADGEIAGRVSELRKPAVEAAMMTLSGHLTTLAELRDAAKTAEDYDAAIRAEVKRGEASGFYVERKEAGKPGAFSGMTQSQLEEEAREALELAVKCGFVKVLKPKPRVV